MTSERAVPADSSRLEGRTTGEFSVRAAVIPAAGVGTRMAPQTRVVPKELLSVGGRPAIDFVLHEAFTAGIEEVLVVSSPRKAALRAYLQSPEFCDPKEGTSVPACLRVRVIDQPRPNGLGDAVRPARDALAGLPFAVLLPDELMLGGSALLTKMLALHARRRGSVVGVMAVDREQISSYGCVRLDDLRRDGAVTAFGFVEKPDPLDAPSRLAVAGRYVLDKDVLDLLDDLKPDDHGENRLTTALDLAAHRVPLACVEVLDSDDRHDVGSWAGWLAANEAVFGESRSAATAQSDPAARSSHRVV